MVDRKQDIPLNISFCGQKKNEECKAIEQHKDKW